MIPIRKYKNKDFLLSVRSLSSTLARRYTGLPAQYLCYVFFELLVTYDLPQALFSRPKKRSWETEGSLQRIARLCYDIEGRLQRNPHF